jgi:NitT/TauT family transport system substrate-binding protein
LTFRKKWILSLILNVNGMGTLLFRHARSFYPSLLVWGVLASALVAIGLTGSISPALAKDRNSPPLKVALLPILDVLPFYVAEERGYFSSEGVQVRAVPVASALERDQLMQSGAIDGMLTEMTSVAGFNRQGLRLRIVGIARMSYPDFPLFRLLAAPGSDVKSTADLAGESVGISVHTIIEYVTDRLLAAEGLDPKKVVKRSVPSIPERYQLLMQGRLKAATLPDPLAKSALEAGASAVVADSSHPRVAASVLGFSHTSLENRPEEVRGFLRAWDRGAEEINRDPDSCRALLLKKIRVPENIQETYVLPPFPRRRIPDEGQWNDVLDWMREKGLVEGPLPYGDSVTDSFLPKGE